MPFLKPCYNLYMRIYATSKELKKKAFPVKCQNMKQAVSMEVTFILVNKHQKNIFYQNTTLFKKLCINFEPLLGQESVYVCHNLKPGRKGLYDKQSQYYDQNIRHSQNLMSYDQPLMRPF